MRDGGDFRSHALLGAVGGWSTGRFHDGTEHLDQGREISRFGSRTNPGKSVEPVACPGSGNEFGGVDLASDVGAGICDGRLSDSQPFHLRTVDRLGDEPLTPCVFVLRAREEIIEVGYGVSGVVRV